VIPFSVIVSFIDSITPGRIYAWRSTIGCKGAATEEKAENMLIMKMNLKAMTSVKERSRSQQCLQKTTILLAVMFVYELHILLEENEVNCKCCKTTERELSEPKGVSHKDWRILYDTCNTDTDKSELFGSSKCRRL
jgi:hypothetical protein